MTGMQWVWLVLAASGGFTIGLIWAGLRDELEELRTELAVASGRPCPRQTASDDSHFEELLRGEIGDTELANRLPLVAPSHVFRAWDLDDVPSAESGKACP